MDKLEFDRCSYPEIAQYLERRDAIILPLGTLEQHGPGCSVGTDYRIASRLAEALSAKLHIMRLPPLAYGVSSGHLAFAGSIGVRAHVFAELVADILKSLNRHGFRKFIIISSHYENSQVLRGCLDEIVTQLTQAIVYLEDFWELPTVKDAIKSELNETGGHGDATDVSLMLHLSSDEVAEHQLVEEWPRLSCCWVSQELHAQAITRTGVIGSNQRKASAEAGKRLFHTTVEAYSRVIEQILQTSFDPEREDHDDLHCL